MGSTPVFVGKRIQDRVAGDRFAECCPGRFAFGLGDGAVAAPDLARDHHRADGPPVGGLQTRTIEEREQSLALS